MISQIVAIIFGAVVLAVVALGLFQRRMVYQPNQHVWTPDDTGLSNMVPIRLRSQDGFLLNGWYAPPRDRFQPTVVLFPDSIGQGVERTAKVRSFAQAGFGMLVAGYRGYGGNVGSPSEEGLYADARAALGWLISRGVPEGQIVLYGESLGAGVAVQMGTEHPNLVAVVLEAPFTRLLDLAPALLPPGFAELTMADRYDNRVKISRVRAPLLIVHGEQDKVVPVAMGHELKDLARMGSQSEVLPMAGHDDVWRQGGEAAVLSFIRTQIEP